MKKILIALISTFLLFSSTAWATTYFEDGGTHTIDYLIGDYVRVDWNQPLTPTTVNVESGASLARITSYNQGVINIFDGSIGTVNASGDGFMTIYGGIIDEVLNQSVNHVNIYGGNIGTVSGNNGGMDIWGGTFSGNVFHQNSGGNIYGGDFNNYFYGGNSHLWGGDYTTVGANSSLPVYFHGRNFSWDGSWGGVLTGEWGDGTLFSTELVFDSPDLIHLVDLDGGGTGGGTTTPVPEPASMLLFGTGIAGLAVTRLRRKKK